MVSNQSFEKTDSRSGRFFPVDALRGLIIILMALDHANYFVAHKHSPGEYWGGMLPVYDTSLAFMTRFVTHLAAPGFFFLMGVGMYLFTEARQKHGWGKWAVIRHFLIRGIIFSGLRPQTPMEFGRTKNFILKFMSPLPGGNHFSLK